jgi:hypothetical protein
MLVRASIYLKRRLRTVRLPLNVHLPRRIISIAGPGYGEFRTDYEPILARIARSQSRHHGPNGAGARTAIVDHGNPGAWHGTSAAAPATTVGCTNDAEVFDGVLSVLDSHEFVFARLMGLANALGCMYLHSPFITIIC